MLNLSVLLTDAAHETPDRDALVFGDMRISYSFLDTVASQVADLLVARGIRPGDKVALASPNLPYFPMVYFGILKAGAVVVPLNVLLKRREIAYHLDDSEAKPLFCFDVSGDLLIEIQRSGLLLLHPVAKARHQFHVSEQGSRQGNELAVIPDGGLGNVLHIRFERPMTNAIILHDHEEIGQVLFNGAQN